ncbi:outer membrane protein assembly factor BamB family protein [Rugosimonospora acidiphila]|uniref:outer membrane protein assembly factor BamB family protein n=1 Tax=Rugosimonospora acidiphila TaxID=556531 RepID=UPI0031E9E56C
MAKGRGVRGFVGFLALLGIVGLVVVYSLVTGWKVLPDTGNWFTKLSSSLTALSKPKPTWQTSVGDQPEVAVAGDGAVVVISDGGVEAHRMSNGEKIWHRNAAWAGVGGSGDNIVILGHTGRKHGYDAVAADTGAVEWTNSSAIAVWTYTDLILDLTCPADNSCDLTARSPATGAARWKTRLAGRAQRLAGANTALSSPRPFDGTIQPPQPAPPLLGFPIDSQIQVVASASGRRLHTYEPTKDTRMVVAGNRVVESTAVLRDGSCRYTVQGRDPDGDRQVWQRSGYDLKTSSGVACEQREDPLGGGGLLEAVGPDNREVLLSSTTGAPVYKLAAGDTTVATDGRVALVRTADGKAVRAVSLSGGASLWTRDCDKSIKVDFASGVALFTDAGQGTLVALSSSGGTLIDVKSGATLLGYAQNGLVIHIGLRVGLVTYGSSTR